jgi:hypothetical protein
MSEYTKGKWEAGKSPLGDWFITNGETLIARQLRHFDAPLIVAAVNACISINPEHPEKVAEGMEDLVKIGKATHKDWSNGLEADLEDKMDKLQQTLAKIMGK